MGTTPPHCNSTFYGRRYGKAFWSQKPSPESGKDSGEDRRQQPLWQCSEEPFPHPFAIESKHRESVCHKTLPPPSQTKPPSHHAAAVHDAKCPQAWKTGANSIGGTTALSPASEENGQPDHGHSDSDAHGVAKYYLRDRRRELVQPKTDKAAQVRSVLQHVANGMHSRERLARKLPCFRVPAARAYTGPECMSSGSIQARNTCRYLALTHSKI